MQTLFTGRHLTHLSSVDSTNNYALELLRGKRLPEGSIIWTDEQTKGRGQRHQSWQSEARSNLTFSLVYYPAFLSAARQFDLNKAISLGLYDFVKVELPENERSKLKVKWPNDLYFERQKLAGILIENTVQQTKLSQSVIGIGLNVNQVKFPGDLPNPASLHQITGVKYDLKKLLEKLCKNLEVRYLQLKTGKLELLNNDYLSALYQFGELREYEIKGEKVVAEISGVSENGQLVLKDEGGREYWCNFKELVYIS